MDQFRLLFWGAIGLLMGEMLQLGATSALDAGRSLDLSNAESLLASLTARKEKGLSAPPWDPRGAGSGPPESQADGEGAGTNRAPQGVRGHLGARLTTVLGTSQPPPCGPRGCSELAQPHRTPLGALGTSGMPGELPVPISSRPSGS